MKGALDVSERLTCVRVSKHIIINAFPATHLEQDLANFRVQNVQRDLTILSPLGLHGHNYIPREIYLIASQMQLFTFS
jgi:hypothetical protein